MFTPALPGLDRLPQLLRLDGKQHLHAVFGRCLQCDAHITAWSRCPGGLSMDIIAAYQFTAQGLGDFTVSCPGGAALPEASAALTRACAEYLGSAT